MTRAKLVSWPCAADIVPKDDLHDARGVDHDLGPPTRRAGVELDRSGGADAAAQAATARFRPHAREKPADVGVLERGVIP